MIPNPQQYHMTRLRRVPSAAHSPSDLRVRLGAGTPNARLLHRHVLTRRQRDDLNHNVFTSSARPPGVCGGSAPASRSFVLAALRALHLDPGPRPQAWARTRTNNRKATEKTTDSHLYGGPHHR